MFLVSRSCFSFSFSENFFFCNAFFFAMPNLQYEKLKFCSNVVDVRIVLCLVELITC